MADPLPPLEPADTRTRSIAQRQRRARREAIPIVVVGVILTVVAHPILLFGPDIGIAAGTTLAILGMLGPILVFLGFMALHTYYENVDEARYFRDDSVGVGAGMVREEQR